MNGRSKKTLGGALAAALSICAYSWAQQGSAASQGQANSGQTQATAAQPAAAAPAAQPAAAAPAAQPAAAVPAAKANQNASLGQKIERAVTWPVREAKKGFQDLEKELNGGPHVAQDQAQATALKAVPGTVSKSEIEKEHGKLLYEFEIQPQGAKKGLIKEVEVNARTGALISVKTEKKKKEHKD